MDEVRDDSRRTEADRAWDRYLATGSPEAFGELYDRTSPVLVLMAARLIGERRASLDRAHDLLQTTFLEAIRSKGRFERGRPVLPWLTTILARRAANHRRRDGGAVRSTTEELVDVEARTLEPGEIVADAELQDVVREALEGLGPRYRSALHLHLLHGLTPLEISIALERPLSTVRSQLRRGLESLRSRLPAPFGAFLLHVHRGGESGAGLEAQIRPSLIEAATPPSVAGKSAAAVRLASLLLMHKSLVAGAAAVLMLLVPAILGVRALVVEPASGPEEVRVAEGLSVQERDSLAPSDGRAAVERRAVETAAPEPPASPTGRDLVELVFGRCVNQFGEPVVGVEVMLDASSADLRDVTGEDGRFTVSVEESRVAQLLPLTVAFAHPDHIGRLLPNSAGDLGDVELRLGGSLEATVLPSAVEPHSHWRAVAFREGEDDGRLELTFSGPDFVFRSAAAIEPGTWTIHPWHSFTRRGEPIRFEIRAGEVTRIHLEPEINAGISGVVHASSGEARVRVHERNRGGIEEGDAVAVASDGSFTVRRGSLDDPDRPPVLLFLSAGHFGRELEVPWGTTGLEVWLDPLPSLVPHVRDELGRELSSYWISIEREPDELRWSAVDEGSRAFSRAPGNYRVWIRVESGVPALLGPFDVQLTSGPEHLDVRLRRAGPLAVRVEDADGNPQPGCTVRWTNRRPSFRGFGAAAAVEEPADFGSDLPADHIRSAATGDDGRALFPRPTLVPSFLSVVGAQESILELAGDETEVVLVVEQPDVLPVATTGVALEMPPGIPEWVDRGYLIHRRDEASSLVATGRRLGDTFWFENVQAGTNWLCLFDPALGASESELVRVPVTPETSRVELEFVPRLPARLTVPALPGTLSLEVLSGEADPVWGCRSGFGGTDLVLPSGRTTLVWRSRSLGTIERSITLRAGRSSTAEPPDED